MPTELLDFSKPHYTSRTFHEMCCSCLNSLKTTNLLSNVNIEKHMKM